MAREHFERIDQAVVQSGLVPHLNAMFAERGLSVDYAVFDAVEIAVGMGLPVRTRYVVPLLGKEEQDLGFGEKDYPGIYFYESFGFDNKGDIYIQLPLTENDLSKIGTRFSMLAEIEEEETFRSTGRPDWWSYQGIAIDFTRLWSLNPRSAERSSDNYGNYYAHVFGYDRNPGKLIPYERSLEKGSFSLVWDINSPEVAKSLRDTVASLDRLVRAAA